MNYTMVYHELVVRVDIPALSSVWREKVRCAIEVRLTSQPDLYGKPLRRSLKGYRKLRVGDYRVVFRIENSKVKILTIMHRSRVYGEIDKRK